MDRAFASGSAGTPPAAPTSPSIGYPTAGNPASAVPATKPGAHWYHMITEEIRAVIVAAGLTPDHEDLTQLSQAIDLLANVEFASDSEAQALSSTTKAICPATLAAAHQGANQSLSGNGYQILPGGLVIQWGRAAYASGVSVKTVPITFPIAFTSFRTISSNAEPSGSSDDVWVQVRGDLSTLAGFTAEVYSPASAIIAGYVNWIAIGY